MPAFGRGVRRSACVQVPPMRRIVRPSVSGRCCREYCNVCPAGFWVDRETGRVEAGEGGDRGGVGAGEGVDGGVLGVLSGWGAAVTIGGRVGVFPLTSQRQDATSDPGIASLFRVI